MSRAQKRAFTQLKNDAAAVLSHEPSRRFLCTILQDCGFFEDQMTGNSETFYRLGQRKTGMQIVDRLKIADDGALLKLLQTAAETKRRNSGTQKEDNDED